MDATRSARLLLAASLLGAGWVAGLETLALALRPGVPAAALGWLGAAAFGLSAFALGCAAVVAIVLVQLPVLGRGFSRLRATPGVRVGLGLLALGLSLALHVVNVRFYVRLYAGIHALIAVATLLAALLGWALLVGPRMDAPAADAARAMRRLTLSVLAGGVAWLVLTAFSVAQVVTDPVLRAAALEQATLLDDELLALDRATGVLAAAPEDAALAAAPLDPELRAALVPEPLTAGVGLAFGANVVLVTIDSMRADRASFGGGGGHAAKLPAFEALAARSLRFSRAYAPSCWTVHSMSAVLYDRLPSQLRFTHVGVMEGFRFVPYRDDSAMVTEPRNFKKATPVPYGAQPPGFVTALRSAGYETATVVPYIYYFREAGVTAQFEHVDEESFRSLGIGASGIAPVPMVERAAHFFDTRDPERPFFLWLHFMDPHAPYDARDGLAQGAGPEARYDSELRYVDGQLAALLGELQWRKLEPRTLVVVHADHGEEFGDHGGEFHATTLYEETVHVPLLLRTPLGLAPRTIDAPVSLLDLGPTLLDLLGVSSNAPLMGRSLVPLLQGEPQPARPLLMECDRFAARKRAYLRWPFKLIVDRATGTTQLFALPGDPRERDNLAGREPALLQAMNSELLELQRELAAK